MNIERLQAQHSAEARCPRARDFVAFLQDEQDLPAEMAARALPDLHFNYDLQVWVEGGIVLNCAHPAGQQTHACFGGFCCNSRRFAGLTEADAAER